MRSLLVGGAVLIFLVLAHPGHTNFLEDVACHRGIGTDCLRKHRNNPNGILPSGARLYSGESIWAPRGEFQLSCQKDGNLVLYRSGNPFWSSGTAGKAVRECVMQIPVRRCPQETPSPPSDVQGLFFHVSCPLLKSS